MMHQTEQSDWDEQMPLMAKFDHWARSDPDRVAIHDLERQLTYGRLDALAADASNRIPVQRKTPGVPLIVMSDNPFVSAVGLVVALKAGMAYCPVSAAEPESRLNAMIDDLGVGVGMLGAIDSPDVFCRHEMPYLRVDIDAVVHSELSHPTPQHDPNSLGWILYTSGTTGRPKGVMQTRRNLRRYVWQIITGLVITEHDRLLCASPLNAHGGAIFTVATLNAGASLHLVDFRQFAIEDVAELIAVRKITVLFTVPTVMRTLKTALMARRKKYSHMRLLRLSGETVTPQDYHDSWLVFPNLEIFSVGLGTTETGAISQAFFRHGNPAPEARVPVGTAVDEVFIEIVDQDRRCVAAGQIGQIAASSAYFSPGYWGDDERTNAVFQTLDDGRRVYLTGDAGRIRPDGLLEHFGRIDDQVQIRGRRVELGEIEAALMSIAGIGAAAVGYFSDLESPQLVAYVVPSDSSVPQSAPDTLSIVRSLRQVLPAYMVPTHLVLLPSLPLTRNGKVDRKLLPSPAQRTESHAITSTDVAEQQLQAIWAKTLNLPSVGIDENFFDLGGHSLLAAQVISTVNHVFHTRLAISTLIEAPTIAEMARFLAEHDNGPNTTRLVPFRQRGSRKPFFCIHGFGGGVADYAALLPALHPEQPFYGLQAQGYDGEAEPDTSIPAMAARYVDLIRSVQENGPYAVGGYCFGGVVAFEVARQFIATGQAVDLVAVIEGYAPLQPGQTETLWQRPSLVVHYLRNVPFWIQDYWYLRDDDFRAQTAKRLHSAIRFLRRRLGLADSADPRAVIGADANTVAAHRLNLMHRHMQAAADYQPEAINVPITLMRIRSQSLLRTPDPTRGWHRLTSECVNLYRIEGSHHNILRQPWVNSLAHALNQALEASGSYAHLENNSIH